MLGLDQRLLGAGFGLGVFFEIFLGILVGCQVGLHGNGDLWLFRVVIVDDLRLLPLSDLIQVGGDQLAPDLKALGVLALLHLLQLQSQFLFAALYFPIYNSLQITGALRQQIGLLLAADKLLHQLAHRLQLMLFVLGILLQREGRKGQRLFAVLHNGGLIGLCLQQLTQPQQLLPDAVVVVLA